MITKLGYRPNEAAEVFGSNTLVEQCRNAGWIKPVVERHKLVLYDFVDLARCWQRICQGEYPPPLPRFASRNQKKAIRVSP